MAKKNDVDLDQIIDQINKKAKDPSAIMRLGDGNKKLKDIEDTKGLSLLITLKPFGSSKAFGRSKTFGPQI